MSNKRVSLISPADANDRPPLFAKHHHGSGGTKVRGSKKRVVITGVSAYRLPRNSGFSPVKLLKRLGAKVARALPFISQNRKSSRNVSSSSSSSSSSSTLARSRSYAETMLDSHRAEAIEDCIEFLNSSSCLSRSSSVTTFSC